MEEHNGLSEKELNEQQFKLFGGYAAFIAALMILTLTLNWSLAWIVVLLFSISEPALVAFLILDYKVRVVQKRRKSAYRGLSAFIGLIPSLVGIAMLIGHVSLIAMGLFLLSSTYWFFVIDWVTFSGSGKGTEI